MKLLEEMWCSRINYSFKFKLVKNYLYDFEVEFYLQIW